MGIAAVEEMLGGKRLLNKRISNKMDLNDLSSEGIPKEALLRLARALDMTLHQIASLLPVTERTLQRYSLRKKLSLVVSERILMIAEVAARGIEVFGGKDRFSQWANMKNAALGGKTPMSLLKTKYGADIVLDQLGRIEHGIIS